MHVETKADNELSKKGAAILECLSLADQAELAIGSLDGKRFSADSIKAIEKVEGGGVFIAGCGGKLAVDQFAGIFGEMDNYSQKRMKGHLERIRPGSFEKIVDSLVFFEDFSSLKPGELSHILSGFSEQTIMEALEGAGPEERSAILSALDAARADKVRSMLRLADPVPMDAVDRAQRILEETARRLGCSKNS